MSHSPGTDRQLLTERAYATDDKLSIRHRTHELYTVPQIDFTKWVLDCITWRGDEVVLDIGAGPGLYFGPVRARIPHGKLVAGDLSFGMVRRQRENYLVAGSSLLNADAQALPFPESVFDVVLANHMLYHVPDLDRALTEIRRVLKPTGVLVAATNSEHNMPEFTTLFRRALLLVTNFAHDRQFGPVLNTAGPFTLENGLGRLAKHFYAVARYDIPSTLVFPEVEPVMAYLDSMRDLGEGQLPEGITWEQFMDVMSQQVRRLIGYAGKLVVNKLSGALVATQAGGFAGEYVAMLKQSWF